MESKKGVCEELMKLFRSRVLSFPCLLQAGKLQFRAGVSAATLTYKDTGLTSRMSYTYVVTAWQDCNNNGVFDAGIDLESLVSNSASATAQ